MNEENKKREEVANADPGSRYWRQLDLIDPIKLAEMPIHVIGCGGIGSAVALYAAKMGAQNITVWDFDIFEIHNLPNQMCRIKDLNKNKAEAVADMIKDFEDIEVEPIPEKFDGDIEPNAVVIMAVDSMKARKEIWEMLKKSMANIVIDGRMGLTALNVYSVIPTNKLQVNFYEKTLWNDEEVAEVPCTAKATIFTAGTIASLICGHLAKLAKKEISPIPCEIAMEMMSLYTKVVDHKGQVLMETTLMEDF
jgi:molybdopterin/thiamine biosynthesis adenylyltransferase